MGGSACARKCLCCNELFMPERRNLRRQKFCAKPACRQASKRHSQHRWLARPQNRDYFRGAENVARVRKWRAAHPGYWRRTRGKTSSALQDLCPPQTPPDQPVPQDLSSSALQDLCNAQLPLLVGLMHQLLDSPLQDDILPFARRLIAKGQDLLDQPSLRRWPGNASTVAVHANQTPPSQRPPPADPAELHVPRHGKRGGVYLGVHGGSWREGARKMDATGRVASRGGF